MYSVGLRGFRFSNLQIVALFIAKLRKYENCVVHLGELDCRVWNNRLISSLSIEKIAHAYIKQLHKLSVKYCFRKIAIITPIPPSDSGASNNNFPRNGSLEERIECTTKLTNSLTVMGRAKKLKIINSQLLVGEHNNYKANGSLKIEYSLDGCHLNKAGTEIIRRHIDDFIGNSIANL